MHGLPAPFDFGRVCTPKAFSLFTFSITYLLEISRPNMTAPEGREASDFKVYIATTEIAPSDARPMFLNSITTDTDTLHFEQAHGSSAQQVCQHHQHHYPNGNPHGIHDTLLLIFDAPNPSIRGILLINVHAYHGYADAIRLRPNTAGMTIASLAMGSSDWLTEREGAFDESLADVQPVPRFILYNTVPDAPFSQKLVRDIDLGLHLINTSPSGDASGITADDNQDQCLKFRY